MIKNKNLLDSINVNKVGLNKKGSMAIESSIFLPIILLAILTLASFIKVYSTSENVMFSVADEAEKLSLESYSNLGKLRVINFKHHLKNRLAIENSNIEDIKIKRLMYMYKHFTLKKKNNIEDLISFHVSYKIKNGLIPIFKTEGFRVEKIKFRAFTGRKNYKKLENINELEKEEEYQPVWIFPKSGKKYHKKNCTYVSSSPIEMTKNNNVNRKYRPCKICKAKNIRKGDKVYCFWRSGRVYHRGNCDVLDKYSVEIDKSEAERRGYKPCLKCGGF